MKLEIHRVEAIGGFRPLTGPSPFASASLVVRERSAHTSIVRISRYEGDTFLVGEPLTTEEWDGLCTSEQAHAFAKTVSVQAGATMWLLRPNFFGRDAAFSELRSRGVVQDEAYDGVTGTNVFVVREVEANPLRDGWADHAFERAREQAKLGRWESALAHAEQAYVLGRGPVTKHWALLALCYDRMGRAKRAQGMMDVARRSHGAAMADDMVALRKGLEEELTAGVTPLSTSLRPLAKARAAWGAQAKVHHLRSLENLKVKELQAA